jgi:hypothetical protein
MNYNLTLKANEIALRCAVLILWQTSPLRRTRLRAIDDVANGLAYYDYTFLHELPRFYAALEDELPDRVIAAGDLLASLPAHGQLDRQRSRRQPVRDGRCPARGAVAQSSPP